MAGESTRGTEQLRTAEVIAALSLATDLGMGFPLEHGLHSTIVAMRLARRLGVDVAVEGQAYFGCLLCYGAGFGDGAPFLPQKHLGTT